jgi:ubiquinone/menaquinone biosynthesis C-methylase UbiE
MKWIFATLWNYPFDPRIHTLGNQNKFHAKIAPYFTRFLDETIYGTEIRKNILEKYESKMILDMGCGVGMSTSANGIGIDTSSEMLTEAKRLFPEKTFEYGNSENYMPDKVVDIVTCMFLMHEVPQMYRKKILYNAERIANEKVIIVDICPTYKPSFMMLMGEPYIKDYLENIRYDLKEYEEEIIIKDHVYLWTKNINGQKT